MNMFIRGINIRVRSDLPGGPEFKNLLASAGHTGSIPGPGGFRMPGSNQVRASQLLSPNTLEPVLCNQRRHHNEKPTC